MFCKKKYSLIKNNSKKTNKKTEKEKEKKDNKQSFLIFLYLNGESGLRNSL